MPSISLPLLPNAYTISYPPTAPDKTPEPIQYFPLTDILTRAWTTDAHTTAYSVEGLSFRLSKRGNHPREWRGHGGLYCRYRLRAVPRCQRWTWRYAGA